MVEVLAKFPKIHQTFNLVPSLVEQLEAYIERSVKDKFLELSYRPALELSLKDKEFILDNFSLVSCFIILFLLAKDIFSLASLLIFLEFIDFFLLVSSESFFPK